MTARSGVVAEIEANAVATKISETESATPMIALVSGNHASRNERNVTMSTNRAISTPAASMSEIVGSESREEVAADGDLRALGQRLLEVGADRLEVGLGLGGDRCGLSLELHADDGGIAVVRDQSRHHLVERIGDGEHPVEVFEGADRVFDRRGVRLVVHAVAVRGDDHDLRAGAARLRERPAELLDAGLGLGAGDREGVVGALHEQRGAAARDAEQQKPGDQHTPRVSVRPAPERIEDGGHGSLRVDRIAMSRWSGKVS